MQEAHPCVLGGGRGCLVLEYKLVGVRLMGWAPVTVLCGVLKITIYFLRGGHSEVLRRE